MSAGTLLRQARKSANIALPAMAEQIGYDKGNLSRIERDVNERASRRMLEWVAYSYERVLGLAPYSLWRQIATLERDAGRNSSDSTIPGYSIRPASPSRLLAAA